MFKLQSVTSLDPTRLHQCAHRLTRTCSSMAICRATCIDWRRISSRRTLSAACTATTSGSRSISTTTWSTFTFASSWMPITWISTSRITRTTFEPFIAPLQIKFNKFRSIFLCFSFYRVKCYFQINWAIAWYISCKSTRIVWFPLQTWCTQNVLLYKASSFLLVWILHFSLLHMWKVHFSITFTNVNHNYNPL